MILIFGSEEALRHASSWLITTLLFFFSNEVLFFFTLSPFGVEPDDYALGSSWIVTMLVFLPFPFLSFIVIKILSLETYQIIFLRGRV